MNTRHYAFGGGIGLLLGIAHIAVFGGGALKPADLGMTTTQLSLFTIPLFCALAAVWIASFVFKDNKMSVHQVVAIAVSAALGAAVALAASLVPSIRWVVILIGFVAIALLCVAIHERRRSQL